MSVSIISEVGSVHDGSLGNALKLIETAAECGVDAVKFQTHIADAETLPDAPMPPYFKGEPRFEYFERTGFSIEEWRRLKSSCGDFGVSFISSPFSEEAVDLLEEVGIDTYKIASGEVTNIPLLKKIAGLGKPVLLSSGMSSWAELDRAVEEVLSRHDRLVVLQCTSMYPCPYEQVGLNVMAEMRERYGVPVGLSDHTTTPYASYAAAVMGAQVIERHVTFSRHMYGSDARHSLEPTELADLVTGIRAIETMLEATVDKTDISPFTQMKAIFEKSLVALANLSAGTRLEREAVGFKKPGTGIPAACVDEYVGRVLARDVTSNSLLEEEDFRAALKASESVTNKREERES